MRDPLEYHRRAAISWLRRKHRPERRWFWGGSTGWCRCGERLTDGQGCQRLQSSLIALDAV